MRKSIDSRIDRIMDRLLPIGSVARAEFYLPDNMRDALAIHRRTVAAIIDRHEKNAAGDSFAALCDGDLQLPEMPRALRVALGMTEPPRLTADLPLAECEAAYRTFALGDER